MTESLMDDFALTVVVAENPRHANVERCLDALDAQPYVSSVLLVHNCEEKFGREIVGAHPKASSIYRPEAEFVPHCWEEGLRMAETPLVALLSSDCIPAANWSERVRRALSLGHGGVGGAIEPGGGAGCIDRAIYFCRYSRYMPPFQDKRVNDFAGDNAGYRRAAIDACSAARENGFWEPGVHSDLIAHGESLFLDSSILVSFDNSLSFAEFMRQRFHHGRQFGRDRARGSSAFMVLLYRLGAPLVPLLIIWRCGLIVFSRKANRLRFIAASPVTLLFLSSWSLGEFVGSFHRRNASLDGNQSSPS